MWVWIVVAGAAGAVARAAVHAAMTSRTATAFPWGTFVAHVVGSFVLGLVVGLVSAPGGDRHVRTSVGTGFLGAFTTFSAFAYETFALVEDAVPRAAVVNVVGSVVAGVLAATAGLGLVGAL